MATTADWAPTTKEVGARLRARLTTQYGGELEDFDDTTRPTGDQVEDLILQEVDTLGDVIGFNLDPRFWPAARRLVVIGTAMAVELGYYPEQVATGRSPYDRLKELYDDRLAALKTAVENGGSGGDDNAMGAMSPAGDAGHGLSDYPTSPFVIWDELATGCPVPPNTPAVGWGTNW